MKQFNKTKLAAAVSTAALAASMSAPANAVVVVGGDNGWEISFDGNVNAFLTFSDFDPSHFPAGALGVSSGGRDAARITSGFLPAFFSFSAKSPTVNGLTGTGRISFAPTINNGGAKTQFYGGAGAGAGGIGGGDAGGVDAIRGASIDTREVLANIDGSFGTISFGRTLSLFGRQAILGDMTLFGVGFQPGAGYGSVTFGRVGHGYSYPDFSSRIAWTSPSMNGFQLAVGIFDPSQYQGVSTDVGGILDETDIPRFEGELTYNGNFQGGNFKLWADGLWQEIDSSCTTTGSTQGGTPITCANAEIDAWGVGGGATIGFGGFAFTGYVYESEGLNLTAQFAGGVDTTPGAVEAQDGDGFYVQGTYTFNGRTKVGISYGESNIDDAGVVAGPGTDVELAMWTVGVYHDITSWLKVIAEYNHQDHELSGTAAFDSQADTFSVGSFIFW